MEVREIMSSDVETVAPEDTLQDAAEKMKSHDVGFLPICENNRLVGTVTDRDIVIRAIADGKGIKTDIRSVMTKGVFYCFDDEDVETCAETMKEKEVKRMLVLNRDKKLVGVVSLGDLAKAHQDAAGGALKDITEAA
jgi:CBS domain-containing protein